MESRRFRHIGREARKGNRKLSDLGIGVVSYEIKKYLLQWGEEKKKKKKKIGGSYSVSKAA